MEKHVQDDILQKIDQCFAQDSDGEEYQETLLDLLNNIMKNEMTREQLVRELCADIEDWVEEELEDED